MIMMGERFENKLFAPAFYISVIDGHVKKDWLTPARRFFPYSVRRPSYMLPHFPQTCAQFLIGIVHFFVASKVVRNSVFNRAVLLGNTLCWVEFPIGGMEGFDPIGRVYALSGSCGKWEVRGNGIPVILPTFHGIRIFRHPFLTHPFQIIQGLFRIGPLIDRF